MNTLIIVFIFCVLLSIDCATKSKHYLVKVGDNDDNKQADDENGPDPSVNSWILGYFSGRIRETNRELQIINDLNIPLYDLLHKTCVNDPNLNLQEAADFVYLSIP